MRRLEREKEREIKVQEQGLKVLSLPQGDSLQEGLP